MARRIKRFFVFLFFSLFFSLLSGKVTVKQDKKDPEISGNTKKVTVWSLNSARAEGGEPCYGECCPTD